MAIHASPILPTKSSSITVTEADATVFWAAFCPEESPGWVSATLISGSEYRKLQRKYDLAAVDLRESDQ